MEKDDVVSFFKYTHMPAMGLHLMDQAYLHGFFLLHDFNSAPNSS